MNEPMNPAADEALQAHEDDVRAALASRVADARPAADEVIPNAEGAVRAAHHGAENQLAKLRLERQVLNDDIRQLVYQEEILRRAVRVFERAEAAEQRPTS
jgi:hypothetical protein